MPKVSIIVPFINGAKYLRKCLESLIKINYYDFEILLVDDSSIDNSKNIIFECINNKKELINKKNIKINYYYLKDNTIGAGKARNYGIEKSKGKYLMFVDVDDYIDKNLLANLEKYIEQDIDLIKYKMEIVEIEEKIEEKKKIKMQKETKGPVFKKIPGERAFNKLCFLDKYFDSPCLYLIKKEYIQKNNYKFPENIYHEDFGLIPLLVASANTVISTNIYGYKYVQTRNSIMRNKSYDILLEKANNKIKHYIDMNNRIQKITLTDDTKQNMKKYYINSVLLALKGLKKEDKKILKEKIKKLKMIDNIKTTNIKQKIKKQLLKIWINN